ncbi:hypothetical protein GCM10023310_70890 [Paenibacillus vulneris]|uniref:Uncharacterized protein n=1 Tax=Paenibacillus vulneris TaxID=1133364 RepID=A0ABW3UFK6_9BACL
MGRSSRLEWQDVYYNGDIDPENEFFDEETQKVHKRVTDDGWDNIKQSTQRIYDSDDDLYLKIKNGQVRRK